MFLIQSLSDHSVNQVRKAGCFCNLYYAAMWIYKNGKGRLPWETVSFLTIHHYVKLVFMQWNKFLKELNWDSNDNGKGFMARYWQEALKISKAADDLWSIINPATAKAIYVDL